MTTNAQPGSAKIYQFPARGRFASAADHEADAAAAKLQQMVNVAIGSGWYHDDAIETERVRKN